MIRTQYQEDNGSNSSPTLEVGVFLLKEDKFCNLLNTLLQFFILKTLFYSCLLQVFFRKISTVCQKTPTHLIIIRLYLTAFPIQGPCQTHPVLNLDINRHNSFCPIIIPQFFIGNQCSDCQIIFCIQICLLIVYRKIFPDSANDLICPQMKKRLRCASIV